MNSNSTIASTNIPLNKIPMVGSFTVSIHSLISEIPDAWNKIVKGKNIFLSLPYLQILENYPPKGYSFVYLIFYNNNIPIGVCYCQLLEFKTDSSIRNTEKEDSKVCENIKSKLKSIIIQKITIQSLVCGNALLSGEHGFLFDEKIPNSQKSHIVIAGLRAVRNHYEKKGSKLSGFFIKDFAPKHQKFSDQFLTYGFHKVHFQPNMYLNIREDWKTKENYLAAFSSKYRTRAKRAFKKGKDIIRKELDSSEIKLHQEKLFQLYQNIQSQASFSLATLHKGYFCGLKDSLGEHFNLTAYYLQNKIIGFNTTIINGKEIEAHFLGLDHQYNRSHQLYLNMLYDMTFQAIDKNLEKINFSRTAMEIKSSIGAVSEDLSCYTRHWNNLPNRFVPHIFSYLNPVEEWTPRSPFNS